MQTPEHPPVPAKATPQTEPIATEPIATAPVDKVWEAQGSPGRAIDEDATTRPTSDALGEDGSDEDEAP